ncbi:Heteroproteinous nuclear ribonucleoprotein A1, partial [Kickxella alabastrina]
MSDPLKEIDDSIYNDDTTLNTTGGTYDAYDPYQTDNQWLYNDTQTLQIPQGGESAGNAAAATAADKGNAANSAGGYTSNDNAANGNDSNNNSSNAPQTVSRNKDEGKLFVGGLSWETDENRLREYFSKYGTIIDCSIMRDQTTGRPRGFGFVTFENIDGVNAVLQEPTHTVDGKQIDPKHAIPRDNQVSQGRNNYPGGQQSHGGSVGNYNANNGGDGGYGNNNSNSGGRNSYEDPTKDMRGEKIFVGGLPPSATDADLNSG